jgi:hypothetical protein
MPSRGYLLRLRKLKTCMQRSFEDVRYSTKQIRSAAVSLRRASLMCGESLEPYLHKQNIVSEVGEIGGGTQILSYQLPRKSSNTS